MKRAKTSAVAGTAQHPQGPRIHLGDSHNFGRRVTLGVDRVHKPRTVFWEWLVLAAESPLRRLLAGAAERDGPGRDAFSFLPDLGFFGTQSKSEGEVERVVLEPLPPPSVESRHALARIVGRALALFTWLGVSDLHWENLVLGSDAQGRTIFAPLDVEMFLADLELPTGTKLLPDADPEYAGMCQHACGVRRALPFLGKPVAVHDLVAMAGAYDETLALLDRHASSIADVFARLPELRETPIRVLLRATGEYVGDTEGIWPPLLDAEVEQMARGDIPYFFRLYDKRGIHYFGDATLREIKTLPLQGDVPQLDPLLPIARGLRSKTRRKLREEGLFTLLGAFDHPSFKGVQGDAQLSVAFKPRSLVVTLANGEELESKRNLSAFVGSVYLPCTCGEVSSVFVARVTRCSSSG